ncbi:MAG: polyprenyl synthetase family protein [Candidatus Omnitrophota bacterium]
MSLQSYLKKKSQRIDEALDAYLPKKRELPFSLHEAMRYAVFSGGKRVRPVLALAACEAVGGNEKDAMPAACALELIHNYSLVHDDLPCMDDDDTRRGRPACHRKFGEMTAVLAGDALLTLAFQLLNSTNGSAFLKEGRKRLEVARLIAEAVGSRGMVGGQAVDMEFQSKELNLPTIEYINTHKSGALIAVSARAGAILGGGTARQVESLYRYGKSLGLLFQIIDDILDREGYAEVIGMHEAGKEAERLLEKAKKELAVFGFKGRILGEIADFVFTRKH